jgi:hypothetical protein
MQKRLLIAFTALLLIGTECTRTLPAQTYVRQLLTCFQARADLSDTVHYFLEETPAGTAISDTLLKTVLDSVQFESLHFGTGEARFSALGQFPFADGLTAAVLRTEEFWFGKKSLLVFDLRQQKCLAVVALSHFYGGDGGQIASESWLFLSKTPPQLFVKTAEHGLMLSNTGAEELQAYLRESGQLFQWEAAQFRPMANPDSSLFLRKYQMNRTW